MLLLALMGLTAISSHAATFLGGDRCRDCHAAEYKAWQGSHHDLAMQHASPKTVLGDFNNASFTQFGVTSTFYKKNGKFMVRTDGPDGKLQAYQVKYTFGVEPLQQYLIEFPGGRLQALSLTWDARPKKQGGQRWFHLYPDEKIGHDDILHWTRLSQNWNTMCAECHSTHLEKNYDANSRSFKTSWSEIDVACEACHGPGSDHVLWAKREPGWQKHKANQGLSIILDERRDMRWGLDPKTGTAVRSKRRATDKEIDMCARCHSRRSPISKAYVHGDSLLDHYLPSLLTDDMYHADGQIDDEVYVYGSFRQSKMYHAGVTCSDCHEPHSLQLRSPGNGVCLQCHQAAKFDRPSHHFHKPKSAGASCAECHMPAKTYMVVDPRHDHSMRIPRPDLSVTLGTPNACNNCHQNKEPAWAAKQVTNWYGRPAKGFQDYAQALSGARKADAGTGNALAALIRDEQAPAIARATALAEIGPYLSGHSLDVLPLALSDDDSVVRAAVVGMLDQTPLNLRVRLAFPMLDDPVRAVRIEAARVLASTPAGDLAPDQRALLEHAMQEYVAAQLANAERAEAQTNLGNFYVAQRDDARALAAYKTALELNSVYLPAYVNLADFYRSQHEEVKADQVLRQAMAINPDNAMLHHVLGLSLVRQKRVDEAIVELRQASTLDPDDARYVYVYAVALNSAGKQKQALMLLQSAQNRHPNNREILSALVAFHRDLGNDSETRNFAEKLRALSP